MIWAKVCKLSFSAGIGGIADGFSHIKRSYKEAKDAVDMGEDVYGIGSILRYEDLGVLKLIRNISINEDISKYIPRSLTRLREVDRNENKELYKTLEHYLKNNQHIKATADELYIHPKTVSYRLQQIKDIMRIDFSNSDKLLEIQFAIKIIKLSEKKIKRKEERI